MKTSSAFSTTAQFNLFSDTEYDTRYTQDSRPNFSSATSAPLKLPTFDGELYAASAKRAGRLNAANTSEEEREVLLRERSNLLDKKFAGNATKAELNRLEYVRWSLDRIEDAKHGQDFDVLKGAVSAYQRLLEDIENLTAEISERQIKTRR